MPTTFAPVFATGGHLRIDETLHVVIKAHCVVPPPVQLQLHSLALKPTLVDQDLVQSFSGAMGMSTQDKGGERMLTCAVDTK